MPVPDSHILLPAWLRGQCGTWRCGRPSVEAPSVSHLDPQGLFGGVCHCRVAEPVLTGTVGCVCVWEAVASPTEIQALKCVGFDLEYHLLLLCCALGLVAHLPNLFSRLQVIGST